MEKSSDGSTQIQASKKTCSKCKSTLSMIDFPDEAARKDGKYPWCRSCLSAHRKASYKKRPKKVRILSKICSLCKQEKPRDQFRKYDTKIKKGTGHLHGKCIECEDMEELHLIQGLIMCTTCMTPKPKDCFIPARRNCTRSQCRDCAKKYVNDNKARIKNQDLINKYGMTLDQYMEVLKSQNWSCAVCKRHHSEFSRMLAVDHAHGGPNKGRVRGLCCDKCNRFVVHDHNTGDLLRAAADYLDREPLPYSVPREYLHGSKKRKRKRKCE